VIASAALRRASACVAGAALAGCAASTPPPAAQPVLTDEQAAAWLSPFADLRSVAIELDLAQAVSWTLSRATPAELERVSDGLVKARYGQTLRDIDQLAARAAAQAGVGRATSLATLVKDASAAFGEGAAIPRHPATLVMVLTPFGRYTQLTDTDNRRHWIDVALKQERVSWRALGPNLVRLELDAGTLAGLRAEADTWRAGPARSGVTAARLVARETAAAIVVRPRSGDVLDAATLAAINDATVEAFQIPSADPQVLRSLVTFDMRSIEAGPDGWDGRWLVPTDMDTRLLVIPDRAELEKSLPRTPAAVGVLAPDRRSAVVIAPLMLRAGNPLLDSLAAGLERRVAAGLRARYPDIDFFAAVVVSDAAALGLACDARKACDR
jgi:hypothetical protein